MTLSQWINNNEMQELFSHIIEKGDQIAVLALRTDDNGDDRGDFEWRHGGSGLAGREDVRSGDVLRVR